MYTQCHTRCAGLGPLTRASAPKKLLFGSEKYNAIHYRGHAGPAVARTVGATANNARRHGRARHALLVTYTNALFDNINLNNMLCHKLITLLIKFGATSTSSTQRSAAAPSTCARATRTAHACAFLFPDRTKLPAHQHALLFPPQFVQDAPLHFYNFLLEQAQELRGTSAWSRMAEFRCEARIKRAMD